jgi:hypothetical protein
VPALNSRKQMFKKKKKLASGQERPGKSRATFAGNHVHIGVHFGCCPAPPLRTG